MIKTPQTKAIRVKGIEFASTVTLPICTNLASPDFPQMHSRLVTSVPAGVARGAQAAVVSSTLHSKKGQGKKLYLIRRQESDEAIDYGQLYLIETARSRVFRIVKPENEHSVRLKTCGIHGSEALLELSMIRSMWLVCAIIDYPESSDEPEEY